MKQGLIILLSIKSIYLDQIKDGTKKYEYRNRYPNSKTTIIFYETAPVQSITAIAKADKPIYKENEFGYKKAIPIKNIKLVKNLSLKDIRKEFIDFFPPQMYYILNNKPDLMKFIKRKIKLDE